ncbi:MAG: hypothetical protein BJ554DRAFT_6723, partial [Olpidium bornovanus]
GEGEEETEEVDEDRERYRWLDANPRSPAPPRHVEEDHRDEEDDYDDDDDDVEAAPRAGTREEDDDEEEEPAVGSRTRRITHYFGSDEEDDDVAVERARDLRVLRLVDPDRGVDGRSRANAFHHVTIASPMPSQLLAPFVYAFGFLVGAKSPSFLPIMASVIFTGKYRLPLCTSNVTPMNDGMTLQLLCLVWMGVPVSSALRRPGNDVKNGPFHLFEEGRVNAGHLIAADDALITFLRSLPQYGTVRSRHEFGRQFWFIDMPDEWQDAKGTILTLLRELYGSSTLDSPDDGGPPPSGVAAAGPGAAAPSESGLLGGPTVVDDPFGAGLRNSANKLREALEDRNISYEPLGFYGPLRNMHISIAGPDEEGRRVDLAIERVLSVEHNLIGSSSIQDDRVFHARRFLARVAFPGGTVRRMRTRFHITLGYYGTRSIGDSGP